MSHFPLTPGDRILVAEWTHQKDEALAFVARSEALIAEYSEDNLFLGPEPVVLRTGRDAVIQAFVRRLAGLLSDHYHCDVNARDLVKDHPDCDADAVFDQALQLLAGQSVEEHARSKIRDTLLARSGLAWALRQRQVTIPTALYFHKSAGRDDAYHLSSGQIMPLITALTYWATGAWYADWRLWTEVVPSTYYATAEAWFTTHPTPFTAIESLRYFKNGRVDVTFATDAQAQDFFDRYRPNILSS